jgi:localization factor PodJL
MNRAGWLFALLAMAGPAQAGYEAGLHAYNRGDYATAGREFEQPALDGDSDAQYWLGRIYVDGLGRDRNPVAAYVWLSRAAAQGHQDAESLRDRLATTMTPDQIAAAQAYDPARQLPAEQETVGGIQRELNRLGYRSGPPDGIFGNRTRRAIEQYQKDAGLAVDGRASQTLLDRLLVTEPQAFSR